LIVEVLKLVLFSNKTVEIIFDTAWTPLEMNL